MPFNQLKALDQRYFGVGFVKIIIAQALIIANVQTW